MILPKKLLQKLYTFASLKNIPTGVQLSVKNRLGDAVLLSIEELKIDKSSIPLEQITLQPQPPESIRASEISQSRPLKFPLGQSVLILLDIHHLLPGKHTLFFRFHTSPYGKLEFEVQDSLESDSNALIRIPRSSVDDYSTEIAEERRQFIEKTLGKKINHIAKYSFDPHTVKGNIENFAGVAQVPLGFAGPLHIRGEHAQGEYYIPFATTEGSLVASYNRGMKVLNLCGGIKCTVLGDAMQRAPVFVFEDARQGREFIHWIINNLDQIRTTAEGTSTVARLIAIDPYQASKLVFLRFNFTTGDAAGQNMVGRAVFAACHWILESYPGIKHFYLESGLAADKKASHINITQPRGKRVTAEVWIKREILIRHLRVKPETLVNHYGIANIGSIFAGATSNVLQSANALAAIFIATGQDVANVAESSAGIIYVELTESGDLYASLTLPSLVVATYGGGTGLSTQRECLELMDCYGEGKVNKFAEIVTGAVAAGELSLAAAISSSDWVSAHEQYGRNR